MYERVNHGARNPRGKSWGGPLLRFVDDEAGGHNFKPLDLLDDDDDSREDEDKEGEGGRNWEESRRELHDFSTRFRCSICA